MRAGCRTDARDDYLDVFIPDGEERFVTRALTSSPLLDLRCSVVESIHDGTDSRARAIQHRRPVPHTENLRLDINQSAQ
jgi:hypothetical protein